MTELQQGMQSALAEARMAAEQKEVPIGAVLFLKGQIVSAGHNSSLSEGLPLQHAEFKVLSQAAKKLSQAEFRQAKLFVTLEPCPMCMGALLHLHLGTLIFGAYNLKWGACGTVLNLQGPFPSEALQIYGGICEQESAALLEHFFSGLRKPH